METNSCFNAQTLQRFNVVFLFKRALVSACHGSPKTQNIQDAVTHPQSGEPLACPAFEQMPSVWEHRPLAHRLPFMRLLPRATSVDTRGQISCIWRLKS